MQENRDEKKDSVAKQVVNNAGETHKYRSEIFMIVGEIIVIVLFAIFTEYKG